MSLYTCDSMADQQSFEDAVIVVQEASAKITEVSKKLTGLDSQNKELLTALSDLTNKVSLLEQNQSAAAAKKGAHRTRNVPLYIRNLLRSVYKDLSTSHNDDSQFNLTEGFRSAHNQEVTDCLVKEVIARHSAADREDIEASCERYYRSLYEDHKRDLNGTKSKHRVLQRRLGRKKLKLQSRHKQFQATVPPSWSSARKERVKLILSKGLAYVSSEESDNDGDLPVYRRRPLHWLRSKYRRSLRQLDEMYFKSLSPRSRQMYKKRMDGALSERKPPSDAPPFLLNQVEDLDTSVSSIQSDDL